MRPDRRSDAQRPLLTRTTVPNGNASSGIKSSEQAEGDSTTDMVAGAKDRNRNVLRRNEHVVDNLLAPQLDENGVVVVSPSGDVILEFRHLEGDEPCLFRGDSNALSEHSSYFKRLCLDTRFSEAAGIARAWETIRASQEEPSQVTSSRLPTVSIIDLGRISPVKSIVPLLTDFLSILHRGDITARRMPPSNLANLGIIADRFDALESVKRWARKRGIIIRPKALNSSNNEELLRQRILTGLLLEDAELVSVHSRDLALLGSPRWAKEGYAVSAEDALWWELPRGLEEEILYRRKRILATLWSLLKTYVDAYTSRVRQCRLGYDTSLQCDVFQCGQFLAFLSRTGFLRFDSNLMEAAPLEVSRENIHTILSTLRQCPSYQVDSNHAHCGPRKNLLIGLRLIENSLDSASVGICLDCWKGSDRTRRSWADLMPPANFEVRDELRTSAIMRAKPACEHNTQSRAASRELFTAQEVMWSFTAQDIAWSPGGLSLG